MYNITAVSVGTEFVSVTQSTLECCSPIPSGSPVPLNSPLPRHPCSPALGSGQCLPLSVCIMALLPQFLWVSWFLCFVCAGVEGEMTLSGPDVLPSLSPSLCSIFAYLSPPYFRILCFFLCLNLFVIFALNTIAKIHVVMKHPFWFSICRTNSASLFSILGPQHCDARPLSGNSYYK